MEYLIEVGKIAGPVGIALVILYLIVKKFLAYLEKRDADFLKLITNHINHNTETMGKLKQSNEKLTIVIEQILSWFKRNGNK